MIRRKLVTASASTLIVIAISTAQAMAQDAHYWTEQFGNRARLLGGAVVASARDLSATFYNPGGLALVPTAEILLAGSVFTYAEYEAIPPSGDSVTSSSLQLSPSLFAGEVPREVVGNNRVAYSFLNRYHANFALQGRPSVSGDSFGSSSLDLLADNRQIQESLSENWFGVTYSRRAAEHLGFGVTTYFTTRSQAVQFLKFAQALGENGRAGAAIQNRQFQYNNFGVLWKIGVATQTQGWDLGVTVTTPRLSFGGSGSTGFDSTVVGQDIDENGNAIAEVATNTQNGLASSYESPFSVAVGGAVGLGTARLHLTAEWFAPVDEFVVLPSEPFIGQSSGEVIDTAITRELTDVLNVALGINNRFSERLTVYGSIRTDRNGFDKDSESSVPVGDWDLYHVAGGATFTVGQSEFTTGAIVSFGNSTTSRVFQPVQPSGTSDEEIEVSYFRFAFLVGFNFAFQ